MLPYILEKIFLNNEESILTALIEKERSVFERKIIEEVLKVDIREMKLKDCTEKVNLCNN